MPLQLGQLVYTNFQGMGDKTLTSAEVGIEIQQAFLERVVFKHWHSYTVLKPGYRAIYLYQIAPEHTLFGWLYNDGVDEIGSTNVPYFLCYYLAEPLQVVYLEDIFTCLHKGPVAAIARHNLPTLLENIVLKNIESYQPARPGVPISFNIRQRIHIALKRGKLLNLFLPLEQPKIVTSKGNQASAAKLNQATTATKTKQEEPQPVKNTKHFGQWSKIFFGAGTRVLISHIVLVIFSTVISLVVIRQLLLVYNENEAQKSLVQEVEEFRRLVKGRNPKTGRPFGNNVAAIFDTFLKRNVPNQDEFLLTFLNGKLYKSSPALVPAHLQPDAALIDHWVKLNQPEWSRKLAPNGNPILYLAEPIRSEGRTIGVFVVLNADVHEHREVAHTIAVVGVVEAIMAVIALTSSFAWLAAGRTLSRLRLLTETARSISDSDLTQRILVQGKDEITELTITFNEMLERLQGAFTSQRNFINDAGHELQTPITIARGHLELLNEEIPPVQSEAVVLVIDELDRMSRFVNELLLLAKAEQPDFLYLETVELSLLTEEVYVKSTALGFRDWHLDAKADGKIVVDRQRITQAIVNLAQNATQYTKEGDVIALGSELTDGSVRFWVRDTGEGIALADQERIFQRFARGSNGRRRSEGAGLGLAIVRAIAEAHGGMVELISQRGCGSTFTIVIPLKNPFRGTVS